MRVAQVSPLTERVPPHLYGGTERVVHSLTEELVRRGHDVTLFASGDSITSARLVAPVEKSLRLAAGAVDEPSAHVVELGLVAARARDFDVVHSHLGPMAFPLARLSPAPIVHTLHGRLDLPTLAPVFAAFRDLGFTSISHAQREPLSGLGVRWLGTVWHGIDVARYPFSAAPGDYLAYLGRICPEKRPDLAIEVARRAHVPLRIAAKVDRVDEPYFDREIRHRLDDPLVEFVGEVDDAEKCALLAGARALLFPIDWPEPFGLVMIEAMACGTPVIARRAGSVPEVVDEGGTGFIGDTIDELVEAVRRVDTISRPACRRRVEDLFSVGHMVDGYEAIYERVAARR